MAFLWTSFVFEFLHSLALYLLWYPHMAEYDIVGELAWCCVGLHANFRVYLDNTELRIVCHVNNTLVSSHSDNISRLFWDDLLYKKMPHSSFNSQRRTHLVHLI